MSALDPGGGGRDTDDICCRLHYYLMDPSNDTCDNVYNALFFIDRTYVHVEMRVVILSGMFSSYGDLLTRGVHLSVDP
jgi:hypothetical protein